MNQIVRRIVTGWTRRGGMLALVFLLALTGCGETAHNVETTQDVEVDISSTVNLDGNSQDASEKEDSPAGNLQKDDSREGNSVEEERQKESEGESQLEEIPPYTGVAYVTINGNVPDFSDEDKNRTDPFEVYHNLDRLGRCGVAYANICKELQPTEERGEIGMVKPSGWHTVKYNDLIDGNYLYNRCHLIGYQLAGENANVLNLITGTRYLNVQGMLPFENEVDDYVDATGNHVLYRVTPIYEGDNLVASGVEMEAWSVEDYGKGVCFHVYCYNVQPGICIDYATGESWVDESNATGVSSNTKVSTLPDSISREYILNTNTKKIHLPTCSSVDDMAEKNKRSFTGTLEELESMGYVPCKRCLP